MNKNPLQWHSSDSLSGSSPDPEGGFVASTSGTTQGCPSSDAHQAQDGSVVEVLKSIGQDCTQQVESYLERCKTNQEGE